MSHPNLEPTRRSLHGVAELVLAGPQYVACRSIRLRVTPSGFGTLSDPDLRVDGSELVSPLGRLPLGGTFAGLARASGVEARPLRDVYADGLGVTPDEQVMVDPDAALVVLGAFARGDAAMRAFALTSSRCCGPSTSTSESLSPMSTTASPPATRTSQSPAPTSGRGRSGRAPSGTRTSGRCAC
jgi:hypothetical protein